MRNSPTPHPGGERVELHALTSLRFFAALHVVLFHTHALIGDPQPVAFVQLISGGHHAVALFFVLSGFILHHTYRRTDWSRPEERRNYLVHRIARIYPVYFLSFLVDAPRAVGYFLTTYDLGAGLLKAAITGTAYLTLTQTWLPRLASAWNAPGWSLSTEAFFYFLLPWLIPPIARLSLSKTVAGLALTLAAASLGQSLPRLAIEFSGVSQEVWTPFISVFPPLRAFEFVFGVLLGRLFAATESARSVNPFTAAALSILATAAILVFSNRFLLPFVGRHHGLLLPFYGVLIVSLTVAANPVTRLLSWTPLRFLGGASYAVYLLHMPLFAYFQQIAARAGWTASPSAFAAYLLAVVGLSSIVFHYYEEPLRRLIRQRFASRPAALSPPPAPPIPPPDRSRSRPG